MFYRGHFLLVVRDTKFDFLGRKDPQGLRVTHILSVGHTQ